MPDSPPMSAIRRTTDMVFQPYSGGSDGLYLKQRTQNGPQADHRNPVNRSERMQSNVTKNSGFVYVLGTAGSLITVWLQVRVLPGPPRTLQNLTFSCLVANFPPLAGILGFVLVSTETGSSREAFSGDAVSGPEKPFPGKPR